jgi:4-amino-4-deoxy-L-arabinose transferase-like glycosyltransferase
VTAARRRGGLTAGGKPYNAPRMDVATLPPSPPPDPTAPQGIPAVVTATSAVPAWRLGWLTPAVCRGLFVLLLAFGFLSHLSYLHHDCPIGLSGDEAQYWEWSRNLDLSYYSKGPLVAYVIRASCAVFGDTMPAVRYPALVLAAVTSVLTYLLARKLFRSDRVALGSVLLYHVVPMFVAGSVLMTIDPPFFVCWATATYLLAVAVFDGKRWAWPAIGVAVGVGFLAKYAMFLWLLSMLAVLVVDRPSRRWLRTRWPWVAVGVAVLFTTPVVVWNAGHNWVSVGHVSTQTGATGAKFSFGNVAEFVGGQLGVVGPAALFMVAATAYAFRRRPVVSWEPSGSAASLRREHDALLPLAPAAEPLGSLNASDGPGVSDGPGATDASPSTDPFARECRFLAVVGAVFFSITFLDAFRTKVQMNWPAPAYFTLMILAAHFLGTRLADRRRWRPWRPYFWFTVAFGVVMMPLAHDPAILHPALAWANPKVIALRESWQHAGGLRQSIAKKLPKNGINARQFDFAAKLKGWDPFGQVVSDELDKLGPGAFILCHDYQQSAELAFYARGQPKTHYAASYYHRNPGRLTQYDLWPDRDVSPASPLVGRPAVFVGNSDRATDELTAVFDKVVGPVFFKPRRLLGLTLSLPAVRAFNYEIREGDTTVRTFRYFLCYGFKGMTRRAGELPH